MARQMAFDLPLRPARGRGDFFVSGSNYTALAAIEGWRGWPDRKLLLTGPEGAGKSHLVQVWAELADARVIEAGAIARTDPATLAGRNVALEDAERLAGDAGAEAAAFHLHNLVLAEGGSLLITARTPPARWGLGLPDLLSRMQGVPVVALAPPDEALLSAVLVKLFTDRQVAAPANLVAYLTSRIERSFSAAQAVVAELDRIALAERRPVTRDLAKRLFNPDPDD
jgi:chromosomal replication initiation ATPase DnaA